MSKDNELDNKLNELAEIRTNNKIDDVSNINRPETNIENMIYEIRGVQVMLDSDLAELFGYETKNLNRQVQRNIERFPNDFCFQLTKKEYDFLRCQNVTFKSPSRGKYRKYLPYAFTEHGIIMLSSLLKSNIAIEMSIKIVKMFIAMRKYLSNNLLEYNHYKNILLED